jgi:hypothetical protein
MINSGSHGHVGTWTDHSVAVLDATLLRLWTEPAALASVLERRGVALSAQARRRKRQPLFIELWKVREGQLTFGSLPLRDAAAVAWAGLLAAPVALASASRPGGRTSQVPGRHQSSYPMHRVRAIGASLGRESADALIARFGQFHEVMLSVPDIEGPGHTGVCRLVLAMFTDSRISQLGAAGFGFRLGKQMADISRQDFATYAVAVEARALLGARFDASGRFQSDGGVPTSWQAWLHQPLLGVQRAGSGALSHLTYGWRGSELARVKQGEVLIRSSLSEQLCAETLAVAGGLASGAEGLHVRNLRVRLSYPKALRWGGVAEMPART